jgi:hypothetical protein
MLPAGEGTILRPLSKARQYLKEQGEAEKLGV